MSDISDKINQVNWEKPEEIIEFYESNQLYFDNYSILTDQDKISDFIGIKLCYANAIYKKSHYDIILRILEQVEQLLNKLDTEYPTFERSERHARYLKGMVLGHQNKYKLSLKIFEKLVKEDPDHYYYQLWYKHSKLGVYSWTYKTLLIIGISLILIDIIFNVRDILLTNLIRTVYGLAIFSYLTLKGLEFYYNKKKGIKT
jgi:tetratricopeptide (TPR) repeat protein